MKLKEFLVHYSVKRFKNLFFLGLSHLPMPGRIFRPLLVKWGGVQFSDYKCCFLGTDISWDTVAPEKIHVGKGAVITTGTIILTHYQNMHTSKWYQGEVYIGDYAFIGARTIISKPVKIGKGAVVGAGSVVTKDIPEGEVWAGNPAKFIRKRDVIIYKI